MKVSVTKWLEAYEASKNTNSTEEAVKLGFIDWIVGSSELMNKIREMGPYVKRMVDMSLVDPDSSYVFFKNVIGNAEEEFFSVDRLTFSRMDDGKVLFCIDFCNARDDRNTVTDLRNGYQEIAVGKEAVKKFFE